MDRQRKAIRQGKLQAAEDRVFAKNKVVRMAETLAIGSVRKVEMRDRKVAQLERPDPPPRPAQLEQQLEPPVEQLTDGPAALALAALSLAGP